MSMRLASNDRGNGDGGKCNGDGDEGVRQVTTRAMAAMRVASDKEGQGSKAIEMVIRLAGKQWQRQQIGQW